LNGLGQPSCDERPVGSLPAFAWGDVSTPIRTITARRSLSPTSHTRIANSVPCGSPAWADCTRAAIRAYHVPCALHDWVRACLSTGGITTTCPDHSAGQPATYLLVNAYQQLWHFNTRDVYQQFTYITHTSQPGSSTPLLLGVSAISPHGVMAPLRGLRCQESFIPHRYQW